MVYNTQNHWVRGLYQLIEVSSFKGTQQSGCPSPVTRGWKQTASKMLSLLFSGIPNDRQSPETTWFWGQSMSYSRAYFASPGRTSLLDCLRERHLSVFPSHHIGGDPPHLEGSLLTTWVFVISITNEFILGLNIMRAYDASMDLKCHMLWLSSEDMWFQHLGHDHVHPPPSCMKGNSEEAMAQYKSCSCVAGMTPGGSG
jgi:hypothetical protein